MHTFTHLTPEELAVIQAKIEEAPSALMQWVKNNEESVAEFLAALIDTTKMGGRGNRQMDLASSTAFFAIYGLGRILELMQAKEARPKESTGG